MSAEPVPFLPLFRTAMEIDQLGREPLIEDCAGDPSRLLVLLDHLRTMRQALATIESAVEAAAANAMGRDRLELPGVVAERKGGGTYKAWEHNIIADRIVSQLVVDPDTGETDLEGYQLATVIREALLDCGHVDYWRTGKLKALGVRFDDAVEVKRGRRTVHLIRAEP